jgi:hypothetical protein
MTIWFHVARYACIHPWALCSCAFRNSSRTPLITSVRAAFVHSELVTFRIALRKGSPGSKHGLNAFLFFLSVPLLELLIFPLCDYLLSSVFITCFLFFTLSSNFLLFTFLPHLILSRFLPCILSLPSSIPLFTLIFLFFFFLNFFHNLSCSLFT